MQKLFILVFSVLFVSFAVRAAPALNGQATQGGMMWGTVPAGTKVWLDETQLPVHDSGVFVFGFGRDAAPAAALRFEHVDGAQEVIDLQIEGREFDIQHIDGLPPKMVTPPPEWQERRKVETGRVRSARAELTPETLWLSGFLQPAQGRFTGFYGSQRILNGKPRSPHYGIDIAAETGTPVYAPAAGIIRLSAPDFLLEGGIIIVDHGLGVSSTLFHLDTVIVEEGQRVEQGEQIGTVGSTGRSTGPHVDWRVNWRSVRLDPLLLLEEE